MLCWVISRLDRISFKKTYMQFLDSRNNSIVRYVCIPSLCFTCIAGSLFYNAEWGRFHRIGHMMWLCDYAAVFGVNLFCNCQIRLVQIRTLMVNISLVSVVNWTQHWIFTSTLVLATQIAIRHTVQLVWVYMGVSATPISGTFSMGNI